MGDRVKKDLIPRTDMICENCNSTTYRYRSYTDSKGNRIVNCPYCPTKYTPTPLFRTGLIKVAGSMGGIGKRSAAHNDDISRRRVAPNGEVYRDRGRVYI